MRLFNIIKNTDSALMKQLNLQKHVKRVDGLLSNISNFPKAKMAEERVHKLVWSGKRIINKKLSDITGRNSIATQ